MSSAVHEAPLRPPIDASVMHLIGHPLPVLTNLACTDRGSVDLFMVSLSRPILVSSLSLPTLQTDRGSQIDLHAALSCDGARQLESLGCQYGALKQTKPELALYGLCTHNLDDLARVREAMQLPFELLSDPDADLASKLELPMSQHNDWALMPCTLLMEEGRILHVDYPIDDVRETGVRALELLRKTMDPFV